MRNGGRRDAARPAESRSALVCHRALEKLQQPSDIPVPPLSFSLSQPCGVYTCGKRDSVSTYTYMSVRAYACMRASVRDWILIVETTTIPATVLQRRTLRAHRGWGCMIGCARAPGTNSHYRHIDTLSVSLFRQVNLPRAFLLRACLFSSIPFFSSSRKCLCVCVCLYLPHNDYEWKHCRVATNPFDGRFGKWQVRSCTLTSAQTIPRLAERYEMTVLFTHFERIKQRKMCTNDTIRDCWSLSEYTADYLPMRINEDDSDKLIMIRRRTWRRRTYGPMHSSPGITRARLYIRAK